MLHRAWEYMSFLKASWYFLSMQLPYLCGPVQPGRASGDVFRLPEAAFQHPMVHLPLRVHPEVLRWVLRRQKNSQPKGRDQGNSKVKFLLSGVRSPGGTPSHTFTFTYSHMSQTLSHFSETFFSKFHLPFHSVLLIPALGLKLLSPEIST